MKQKTPLALLEEFISETGTSLTATQLLAKIQELKPVEKEVVINTWMDSDVCTNAEDYFNETFEQ